MGSSVLRPAKLLHDLDHQGNDNFPSNDKTGMEGVVFFPVVRPAILYHKPVQMSSGLKRIKQVKPLYPMVEVRGFYELSLYHMSLQIAMACGELGDGK